MRGRAVGCLGDDSEVWFCIDDRPQATPDEVLVIGDEHADRGGVHHSFTTGSVDKKASTVNRVRATRAERPAAPFTRSPRPVSPKPGASPRVARPGTASRHPPHVRAVSPVACHADPDPPGVGVAYDVGQAFLHDAVDDVAQVPGDGCLLEGDASPWCASGRRGSGAARGSLASPGPPIAPESSRWNIISSSLRVCAAASSTVFNASRAASGRVRAVLTRPRLSSPSHRPRGLSRRAARARCGVAPRGGPIDTSVEVRAQLSAWADAARAARSCADHSKPANADSARSAR